MRNQVQNIVDKNKSHHHKNLLISTNLWILRAALLLLLLPSLSCIARGNPSPAVEYYLLEYSSPIIEGLSPIEALVKIERFSVAQAFNTLTMVYKPSPYKSEVYYYHRWRINPADMVTDFLLRDFRNSGLYKGVFSYQDIGEARYLLQGQVEEFVELDDGDLWQAIFKVSVTLTDTSRQDGTRRVIFQRGYRYAEPMKEQTPIGLAQGLSVAMKKFSENLIRDVHAHLKSGNF